MKKYALALVAMFVLAGFAGMAEAQRGGGGGGGHGGGGWSGGGGGMHSGGGWSGGGGGWHGGSGWHGGGWNGGWHGGGWNGGWHGGGWNGGWRGGCWGCSGWRGGWGWWGAGWWGGVAIAAPWWGWPWGWGWGWGAPAWGATVPVTSSAAWWGQDPVFVEQQQSWPAAAPSAPSAPSAPPVTWFYCTQPAGYYPYVQNCSKPWMRVVPDATQPPPASYQPQQG